MLKLIRHSQHNGLYGKDTHTNQTFFLADPVSVGEIFNPVEALELLASTAINRGVEFSPHIPPRHE